MKMNHGQYMKKVIYRKEVRGKSEHDFELQMVEDKEFGKKMERIAIAYAKWDSAVDRAMAYIEKHSWNAFYDKNGFEAQDKAADRVAKLYNACFKTNYDGETFIIEGMMSKVYFIALNHGTI